MIAYETMTLYSSKFKSYKFYLFYKYNSNTKLGPKTITKDTATRI